MVKTLNWASGYDEPEVRNEIFEHVWAIKAVLRMPGALEDFCTLFALMVYLELMKKTDLVSLEMMCVILAY